MSTSSGDLYARAIYAALTEGRLDCRPWHEMTDNRREMYRRAADAVEAEMGRFARPPSRVVAMRTRTVETDTEETGT